MQQQSLQNIKEGEILQNLHQKIGKLTFERASMLSRSSFGGSLQSLLLKEREIP